MPQNTAPVFLGHKDATTNLDGSVTLNLKVDAKPFPRIEWFRGNVKISQNSCYSIKSPVLESIFQLQQYAIGLRIADVSADDGGIYKCIAINADGRSEARVTLNLIPACPPTLVGKPQVSCSETTNERKFVLHVQSKDTPIVLWSTGDDIRESNMRQTMLLEASNKSIYQCTLVIAVDEADEFIINVHVSNSLGLLTASFSSVCGDFNTIEFKTSTEIVRLLSINCVDDEGRRVPSDRIIQPSMEPTVTASHTADTIINIEGHDSTYNFENRMTSLEETVHSAFPRLKNIESHLEAISATLRHQTETTSPALPQPDHTDTVFHKEIRLSTCDIMQRMASVEQTMQYAMPRFANIEEHLETILANLKHPTDDGTQLQIHQMNQQIISQLEHLHKHVTATGASTSESCATHTANDSTEKYSRFLSEVANIETNIHEHSAKQSTTTATALTNLNESVRLRSEKFNVDISKITNARQVEIAETETYHQDVNNALNRIQSIIKEEGALTRGMLQRPASSNLQQVQRSLSAPKTDFILLNLHGLASAEKQMRFFNKIREFGAGGSPVLICTETHLTAEVPSCSICPTEYYNIQRSDRSTHGGGLACFVPKNKELQLKPSDDFERKYSTDCKFDAIVVHVKGHQNDLLTLCIIYCPQRKSDKGVINTLVDYLKLVRRDYPDVIIVGDFNLPQLNMRWVHPYEHVQPICAEQGRDSSIFFEFVTEHNLMQHVKHSTNKYDNILDLVISSETVKIGNVEVKLPYIESDHNAVYFQVYQ